MKFVFMRTCTGLKVHYDMIIPKHDATNTSDKAPCILTLDIKRRRIDTLSVRQWAEIAQSVLRLATGWMVRGSNLGGGATFSAPNRNGFGADAGFCTVSKGSVSQEQSGRSVAFTTHSIQRRG
jgi:hypothetical protein